MFVECTVGKMVFILLSDKITEREKFNGSFFLFIFISMFAEEDIHARSVCDTKN